MATTTKEALREAEFLQWPIVVKPCVSRLYRHGQSMKSLTVTYADSRRSLGQAMECFEAECDVLLQEYSPGVGEAVNLLMSQGKPLAVLQHKRLREIPITGGVSSYTQTVALDPTLYAYSVRLMAAINWTGLAQVEFKTGPEGSNLMEINGRVWATLPLALQSGMDFPEKLADLYLSPTPDCEVAQDTSYVVGKRGRNLERDLTWVATVLFKRRRYPFLEIPKRRAVIPALLGMVDPRCEFEIQTFDDPWPGLADIPKICGKFIGRLTDRQEPMRP